MTSARVLGLTANGHEVRQNLRYHLRAQALIIGGMIKVDGIKLQNCVSQG
jgi:hypothetical protein